MSVKIIICRESEPPFAPDAVVVEDDTQRVLGADPVARERYEDVGRALERAEAAEPEEPGSILVREGAPVTFHAIVHDLESEPSWSEAWVVDALYRVLGEADRRQLSAIAMPILGAVHGSLETRRFAQLLRSALCEARLEQLEKVWLVAPAGSEAGDFEALLEFDLELRLQA
jgi:hypothetical protein